MRLRQCSQNVDVNGPHHKCFELIVPSSFYQPMAVERGRSHELVGFMVGAVYVLTSTFCEHWSEGRVWETLRRVLHPLP